MPAHADGPKEGSATAATGPRVMTLPEALAYARAHQPAVRAALARVAAQEQAARIPRAEWLPQIGVTAQIFAATANNTTGMYVNTPSVDVPRIGGSTVVSRGTMQPYPSTLVGAGLRQEIFDFGRIAAQSAAADALVDVARRQAATERLDRDFAVEGAYFAVYAAKAVQRAADEAYERARVHRDLAKAGVESGMRPPLERTRAEADLARFGVGKERARAGVAVAQGVLAAAVGVSESAVDVLAEAPLPRDLPSLAEAMRAAETRDPRILEAEARVRAQEQATKAIRAELRPNLALTSSFTGRAGGAPPSGNGEPAKGGGWAPDVPNWDIGVVLTWPVWNGSVAARARAAEAREQVEREELARVRFEHRVGVQQALVAVRVAQAALPALERSVEAARDNHAQAEARFKSGVGNGVELADAEALRTQAEIDLALGRYDLARARIALGRAIAEEP
ncbi:outer membrane efflux protein [Minicystis rosea]|nr:outer membrane efflux protein [Minicystis rosea]